MTSLIKAYDPFFHYLRHNLDRYIPQEPGTYTRSSIVPEDDRYRVSVIKYKDGNSDSIMDYAPDLMSAKKFVNDNL